jgi:2-C-methyl-D-erythritol 4-phosphate cytidylyltransferase
VVAAGAGNRFGGAVPKQFLEVGGRRLVDWSVRAAASVSESVVVVVPEGYGSAAPGSESEVATAWVTGGATRSESVRAGLDAVPDTATVILVHDAARPVATAALFERVVAAVRAGAVAVVPVVPVVDTIRDDQGRPVDRSTLQAVQTPQGFSATVLRQVHAGGAVATDDASLVREAGLPVVAVEGERWNIKVTEPEDRLVVAALLGAR